MPPWGSLGRGGEAWPPTLVTRPMERKGPQMSIKEDLEFLWLFYLPSLLGLKS